MSKEQLRSQLLGKNEAFKDLPVEHGGVRFVMRHPTVGERREITQESIDPETGLRDFWLYGLKAAIRLAVDPDTRESIFTDADLDDLLGRPSGGLTDTLFEAALTQMNVRAGDAVKNYETTQNSGESSN
jgi:hypothetical protein